MLYTYNLYISREKIMYIHYMYFYMHTHIIYTCICWERLLNSDLFSSKILDLWHPERSSDPSFAVDFWLAQIDLIWDRFLIALPCILRSDTSSLFEFFPFVSSALMALSFYSGQFQEVQSFFSPFSALGLQFSLQEEKPAGIPGWNCPLGWIEQPEQPNFSLSSRTWGWIVGAGKQIQSVLNLAEHPERGQGDPEEWGHLRHSEPDTIPSRDDV